MILDYILNRFTEQSHAMIIENKCIYSKNKTCVICKDICPEGAISIENEIKIDNGLCSGCGICKAICPTQSIVINSIGEENILRAIKDQKNIIFSCSKEDGIGSLKLNCLNSFNSELLAALFILYDDKKLNFNFSRCETCKYCNNYTIFEESMNKAIRFVKKFNIEPRYEIYFNEKDLIALSDEAISRRELFMMLKRSSTNLAAQTINTIVRDNNYLSIRKVLLNAINSKNFNIDNIHNPIFFMEYEVNENCNGCGKCEQICPGRAWRVDNKEESIEVYHNVSKCHNCGLCIKNCPENAIDDGIFNLNGLEEFNIKNEIVLTTCKSCGKKFLSKDESDKCTVCLKKDELRKKISSY